MNSPLAIFLTIAAMLQLAIAVLNLFLVPLLKWREALARMPLLLREVFQVHAWFISITLTIFAAITWRFASEMAGGANPICQWLAAGIGAFWAIRAVLQMAYYSSTHWRGQSGRTLAHIGLLIVYGGFAAVYLWTAWGPAVGKSFQNVSVTQERSAEPGSAIPDHTTSMKSEAPIREPEICDIAKQRLVSGEGDPFLFADWERVVFLHYVVDPGLVRPHVPESLALELYDGKACISVAAVTMRGFRPCQRGSTGWLFRPIAEQRFLNFRTYVRCGEEPGVLFVRGWVSQPFGLGLPSGMFGLPYAFASLDYRHKYETGVIHGQVMAKPPQGRLSYRAAIGPTSSFKPCEPGSLSEFAMERCTGFFCRGDHVRVFRAWHPPWQQTPIHATIEEDSLLTNAFPWFKDAKLSAANFAPGFQRVWLGRAHRVQNVCTERRAHKVLSAFYEIP